MGDGGREVNWKKECVVAPLPIWPEVIHHCSAGGTLDMIRPFTPSSLDSEIEYSVSGKIRSTNSFSQPW